MRDLDRRAILGGMTALLAASGAKTRPTRFPPPDTALRVPVQGGEIYVRVNGRLDGPRPPLILIHGGPGGTHHGLMDAIELADERAIILYDQLDSGLSDHPGDPRNWVVSRFVDELDAIARALGIQRWHVLGQSWGGTVALEYGARRRPALAGLALAGPLISTRRWLADAAVLRSRLPEPDRTLLKRCEGRPRPAQAVCDAATQAFYAAYLRRTPLSSAQAAYRPEGDQGRNDVLYRTLWGPTEFVSTGTLKRYDGEPLLARLDPRRTLLMVGQYDEARPSTALSFARRLPGAEVAVIPGAGHASFSDRPDEVVAVLRAWLRRQDGLAA